MPLENDKKVYRAARKKTNTKREALEWVRALAIAAALTLFINFVLIVNAQVPTASMENTINPGDRVVGLRTSYWFSEPKRGDIIIFRYPDDEKKLYVKRIIGMPGDTVSIVEGRVYLNGSAQPLDESAYLYGTPHPTRDFGPYQVPAGCYFVMGDNRNNSEDSRYWKNTYVQKRQIIGRAVLRIFPDPYFLQ